MSGRERGDVRRCAEPSDAARPDGERGLTVRFLFRPCAPVGESLATAPQASRAARTLALAHHVERLIEAGKLADYAAAARALGVTRARLTQVMNLLLLAPDVQEAVLTGEFRGSERALRAAVAEPAWEGQITA